MNLINTADARYAAHSDTCITGTVPRPSSSRVYLKMAKSSKFVSVVKA